MSDARDNDNDNDNVVELTRRRSAADGSAPPDRDSIASPISDVDGHLSAEALSAWLDDPANLDASARTLTEKHLAGCAVCQTTLGELRAIIDGLAALPLAAVPRSFALTPELLASTARASDREPVLMTETRAWYARQLSALRWATAVAALLFVFVLGADFFTRGVGNDASDTSLAPVSEQSSAAGEADEAATPASATDSTGVGGAADAAEAAEAPTEQTTEDSATTLQVQATESVRDGARTTDDEAEGSDESTVASYDDDSATKQADATASEADSRSTLRLLQVGLALAIVWLLAAIIAIPRLRPRDR